MADKKDYLCKGDENYAGPCPHGCDGCDIRTYNRDERVAWENGEFDDPEQ